MGEELALDGEAFGAVERVLQGGELAGAANGNVETQVELCRYPRKGTGVVVGDGSPRVASRLCCVNGSYDSAGDQGPSAVGCDEVDAANGVCTSTFSSRNAGRCLIDVLPVCVRRSMRRS